MEQPPERAKKVPEKFRRLYVRATRGEASRSQAIKAKCQECMGWDNAAAEIRICNVPTCPLWAYRPYRPAGQGAKKRARKCLMEGGGASRARSGREDDHE